MAKSVKNNFTSSSFPPLKNNGKLVSEAEEKANTLAAIFLEIKLEIVQILIRMQLYFAVVLLKNTYRN